MAADPEQPPLTVQVRDVGADAAGASAAVRELVTGAGAAVVVGPLLTEAAVTAADTARELGVPLVSFSKSESFQTGSGIFRLGATTSSQVDALVNAAYGEYQLTRFAIVYPRTAGGSEYAEEFRRKVGSLGLSLVYEGSYAPGDEGALARAAQEIEASDADALLIPDTVEVSSRLLANFNVGARKRIRPLGTALWDTAVKIANSQTLFEGAVFVTPFFAQSMRPVVQEFTQSYRGRYQVSPNFLAAQGFDVGTIVRFALRQSLREGVPFADVLSHLPPYDGVTGAISFEPGVGIRRTFYVVEVTKDSFLEKASGGEPERRPESFTFRGNQQLESQSMEPARRLDERVPSGY
jgi:ABC-type branched-subunit amino acid transport system substrate-binding protein